MGEAMSRDGIPEGFRRVTGLEVVISGATVREVLTNGRTVIVLGDPPDTSDGGHNCDEMGCGRDHVLCRIIDHDASVSP